MGLRAVTRALLLPGRHSVGHYVRVGPGGVQGLSTFHSILL